MYDSRWFNTAAQNSLGKSTVSIPRARYINGVVPVSAAAVTLQSAAVVHDQCSPWWDAGRNLPVQTQHPLPPPLALHHLPSAQAECWSLGGPQGARSRMQEHRNARTQECRNTGTCFCHLPLGPENYWRTKGRDCISVVACIDLNSGHRTDLWVVHHLLSVSTHHSAGLQFRGFMQLGWV